MRRYKISKLLGDGTYGSVVKAQNIETGEWVAIKKMKEKFSSWQECLNNREVQVLNKLRHPNIIGLKEVIREDSTLYFVFEYMNDNLYHICRDLPYSGFSESQIRNMMYQIIQGIRYMHQRGYFHRDIKPENVLHSRGRLKLCDFGLAKNIRSGGIMTEYVSTRWYRAPEVILKWKHYNYPIDVWAVGTVMAELYLLKPLFPGNSATDQLYKICSIMGSPNTENWSQGVILAKESGFRFPRCKKVPLKQLIPTASKEGLELIEAMLSWNPSKRPDATSLLNFDFFAVGSNKFDENKDFLNITEKKQQKKDLNEKNLIFGRKRTMINGVFQY